MLLLMSTLCFFFILWTTVQVVSGTECYPGEYMDSGVCTACPSGTFLPDYNSETSCNSCPTGWVQPDERKTRCNRCTLGKYASNQVCELCAAGQIAPVTASTSCTNCDAGFYQDATGESVCKYCPVGWRQANDGQINCHECPDGWTQTDTGQTTCEQCPKGYSSTESESCTACPVGTFSNLEGQTSCQACPNGYAQSSTGQQDCHACQPGLFGSGTEQSACQQCSAGTFTSSSASISCQECPIGYAQFNDGQSFCSICPVESQTLTTGQTICQECPTTPPCCVGYEDDGGVCKGCSYGKYHDISQQKCESCPNGYFSTYLGTIVDVEVATDCFPCESGHYIEMIDGRDKCQPCPAGTYEENGLCIDCSAGRFQPSLSVNDSSLCLECAPGTYSLAGQSDCLPCDPGTFEETSGSSSCLDCPAGKVSPAGAINCSAACPNYTYPLNGQCSFCPAGKTTNQLHPMDETACVPCAAGFVKRFAFPNECSTCRQGLVASIDQTDCEACPDGYTYLPNSYTCSECPAGQFKPSSQSIGPCNECLVGTYQALTGQASCTECSPGMFQDSNSQISCKDCDAGNYMPNEGAILCLQCPNGYGTSFTKQTQCNVCNIYEETFQGECQVCPAGKQLLATSEYINSHTVALQLVGLTGLNATSNLSVLAPICTDCPAGYASPVNTSCSICPEGKYSNIVSCEECPSGFVPEIIGEGSSMCINCSAVNGPCQTCADGQFFDIASTTCKQCPSGKFNDGQVSCSDCLDSLQIPNNDQSACVFCPDGQTRSTVDTCEDCSTGKFSFQGECLECERGHFQSQTGQTSCDMCPTLETTSSTGQTSCDPCPPTATVVLSGICANCAPGKEVNADKTACLDCPAGQYRFSNEDECSDCEPGLFRADTSDGPCELCPAGFFNTEPGAEECSDCSLNPTDENCGSCAAGKFASGNSCLNCPAGFVSVFAQDTCQECSMGTYQDQIASSICKACELGKYQPSTQATSCISCELGKFQPNEGQGACHDCEIGRYSSQLGSHYCQTCPSGTSTNGEASTASQDCVQCPAGRFENNNICIDCAEGTYQSTIGQVSCDSCPANHLSPSASTSSTACFDITDMVSYVFGMKSDGKEMQVETKQCEIRPNLMLLCPACTCDSDSRNGFFDGPICNECRRGFATRTCTVGCAGYDGTNDETICHGKGKCWFGKFGNGLCYCGGLSNLDASSNNVVVDVRTCPKGKICPGYGVNEMTETKYIPLYYIMQYRQYSTFVLQLNQYTPKRGHMWFKRFSPNRAYENTCLDCVSAYENNAKTVIGYYNKDGDYTNFIDKLNTKNGFHGENCQYECGLCINGRCSNVAHSRRYSYTVKNTKLPRATVFIPTTTCICSKLVFDPNNMCCPRGFQPYVHPGKRNTVPYTHFTSLPFITSIENEKQEFWMNKDILLFAGIPIPYVEPENSLMLVTNDNNVYSAVGTGIFSDITSGESYHYVTSYRFTSVKYDEVGPYNKHIFYGTPREICRACPGLFGKGVKITTNAIESETEAEDYWWDNAMGASARKCNGVGVCDFYKNQREQDVHFMGSANDYRLLKRGQFCSETFSVSTETDIDKCAQGSTYFAYASPYKGGWSSLIDFSMNYKKSEAIQAATTNGLAYAEDSEGNFGVLNTNQLPPPSSDSEYTIYPTSQNCYRFNTCSSYEFNSDSSGFNLYKNEKGQGDDRLTQATFDRFDTCFTFTTNQKVSVFGLYKTIEYKNGMDPFLGGLCPKGHYCTKYNDIGYKEACPAGYYQPMQGQTRTSPSVRCNAINYASTACYERLSTEIQSDYVDKICIRCPPNHIAPEGSGACTECPSGRVKKFSGVFDEATPMNNFPTTMSVYNAWYSHNDETGNINEDCALVPESIIHIPTVNRLMDYNSYFMPLLACPYGYTSRPGSFIYEGSTLSDITKLMEYDPTSAVIPAPYLDFFYSVINQAGVPSDLYANFVRENCRRCQGNSVSGRGTGLCTTCYSNRLKLWAKDALAKVAEKNDIRMKVVERHIYYQLIWANWDGTSVNSPDPAYLHNIDLEAQKQVTYPSALVIEPYQTGNSQIKVELSDCYLSCSMMIYKWALTAFTVNPNTNQCLCSIGTSSSDPSSTITWFKVAAGTSKPWDSESLPLCAACSPGKYSDSATGSCVACNPGFYTSSTKEAEQFICQSCAEGRFQANDGATGCLMCPKGFSQDEKAKSSCDKCGTGKYSDSTGMLTCKTCPWGQHSDRITRERCIVCPKGYYQPQAMQDECKGCDPGLFNAWTGLGHCSNCPHGKYSDKPASESCDDCRAGRYSIAENYNGAAKACQDCERGQFSVVPTSQSCTDCYYGKYAQDRGQTECKKCPGGTKCTKTGRGGNCNSNTYNYPNMWSETCATCPREQYPAGATTVHGHTFCEWCPEGKTTLGEEGQTQCVDCPTGRWRTSFNDNDNDKSTMKFASTDKSYGLVAGSGDFHFHIWNRDSYHSCSYSADFPPECDDGTDGCHDWTVYAIQKDRGPLFTNTQFWIPGTDFPGFPFPTDWREIPALARLEHSNIFTVIDSDDYVFFSFNCRDGLRSTKNPNQADNPDFYWYWDKSYSTKYEGSYGDVLFNVPYGWICSFRIKTCNDEGGYDANAFIARLGISLHKDNYKAGVHHGQPGFDTFWRDPGTNFCSMRSHYIDEMTPKISVISVGEVTVSYRL